MAEKNNLHPRKDNNRMKMKEKFGSILLIAVLLLSSLFNCFVVVADSDTPLTEQEVFSENKELKRAVEVLNALGVIPLYGDGTFRIGEIATRADMVVNILRLMNITEEAVEGKQLFSDVSPDYWAYNEINVAHNIKIMNGYNDGLFRPDAGITLNEAVKVLVTLLGYSNIAESRGGYPTGYTAIAHEKGIVDGIFGLNSNLPINRGTMAMLLYNSISVPCLEVTSFGDEFEMKADDNITIISKYRNVHKSGGLVIANTLTKINNSDRDANTVVIATKNGEEEYAPGTTDANSLLGYYVEYYYEINKATDEKKLIYISKKENQNEVLEIKAEQISEETTNLLLKYYKDKKKETKVKTADIYEGANVIYNGVYAGYKAHALDASLLRPNSGGVTLFDTDWDGKYDIVSIRDSRTVFVDSISENDKKIYDKYLGKPISLEDDYEIKKDGEKIVLGDVKVGDILSVTESHKFTEITVVTTQPLSGSVATVCDDKLVIAGKEFEISQSYNKKGGYQPFDPVLIKLGDEGTFYFDIDEKIAAFIEYASEIKYGFVIKAKTIGTLDKQLLIRIFEEDGIFTTYTLSKKVEIDGEFKNDAKDIETYLNKTGMNGKGEDKKGIYQMIAYKRNSEGEINFIDTTNVGEKETLEETFTLDIDYRKADKQYEKYNSVYFETPMVFAPRFNAQMPNLRENGASTAFTVTKETPVFMIPVDENIDFDLDNAQEDEYSVIKASGLKTEEYAVSAYSLDKNNNNEAKIVMMKVISGGSVDPEDAKTAVVVEKKRGVDSDGNSLTVLTLLQAGKLVDVRCKDNALVKIFNNGSLSSQQLNAKMTTDYIQEGHTIIYSQSVTGLITNIDVLFPRKNIDTSKPEFGTITKEEGWVWGTSDTHCKVFGQVLRKSGTKIKVKLENVRDGIGREFLFKTIYHFYDLSSANISIVDVNNQSVKTGTINEIIGLEQGDSNCYALCTMRSNVVDTVVVYKF